MPVLLSTSRGSGSGTATTTAAVGSSSSSSSAATKWFALLGLTASTAAMAGAAWWWLDGRRKAARRPRRLKVRVVADRDTCDVLRRSMDTDRHMLSLQTNVCDVVFEEERPASGYAAARGGSSSNDSSAAGVDAVVHDHAHPSTRGGSCSPSGTTASGAASSVGAAAAAPVEVSVDGVVITKLSASFLDRRQAALPPFLVRWLRYLHFVVNASALAAQAQPNAAATAAAHCSAGSGAAHAMLMPSDPASFAGSPVPSVNPSPAASGGVPPPSAMQAMDAACLPALPPPKNASRNSADECESGAVAGARPELRRRRTVEERIARIALDVLAPLTARAAKSPGARRRVLGESDLPQDAFVADHTCHPLFRGCSLLTRSAAASLDLHLTGSDYATALLYLLDVHDAHEDPVMFARTIADEAAARIVARHRGNFDAIRAILGQVIGSGVADKVRTEAQLAAVLRAHNLTIASQAHGVAPGAGAYAAGPGQLHNGGLSALIAPSPETVTLLSLPQCGLGAVYLLREVYDSMTANFGRWTMQAFIDAMATVWERGGRQHPTGWSRLFRSMNRSRSGEVSFEEFVCFFTKKVSACGESMSPDLALVLSLSRQRLLHLLFFGRRSDWHGRSFWFDALVDMHDFGE